MDAPGRGLAGAGALVFLFSLLLPWYSLEFAGTSLTGRSGWASLGGLAWPALLFGVAAGWQGLARWRPAAPLAAAGALGLIVIAQAARVPDLGGDAITETVLGSAGVAYERAYGLWTAVLAAGLALFGAAKMAANGR